MTSMKRFRVGYYLSMTLLLVAGLGSGRWEFYFLFTTLALLVCFAFAMNLWTIFTFSYSQELSDTSVVKGDSPVLKISIFNNKPFAFAAMCVAVQMPPPTRWTHFSVNLDPGASACYDIPMQCGYRGVYNVGPAALEVSDVFGLLSFRYDLRRLPHYKQEQIIVYPRLLRLVALSSPTHNWAEYKGSGVQRLTQDGESFSDTRKYRFGDPFKRVHRIISARKRQLFVKRYDLPMETAAIIAIDTCENGLEGEDALRYSDIACECGAALAHYCLQAGYFTTLISSDTEQPTVEGRGMPDFPKFYDYLAVMKFGAGGDVGTTLSFSARAHRNHKIVYVISSRADQALTDVISALAQAGCQVRVFVPQAGDGGEVRGTGISISGVTVSSVAGADDISPSLGLDNAAYHSN